MNGINTSKVSKTLSDHGLEYLPEAHNYLLVCGEVLDCTTRSSGEFSFIDDVIASEEIKPEQVGNYKVAFHKDALEKWLAANNDISYNLEQLYAIREQCIEALSRV